MEARALVSGRLRPLRIDGKRIHQVGIPYNYGRLGFARGDSPGELIALSMDPNVSIHESKTLTCMIRAGRRAPFSTPQIQANVSDAQHTTMGESSAFGAH